VPIGSQDATCRRRRACLSDPRRGPVRAGFHRRGGTSQAPSTKRSIWPRQEAAAGVRDRQTTAGPSRCSQLTDRGADPGARKAIAPAFPHCRLTATMCWSCGKPWRRHLNERAPAAARLSSRHSPIAQRPHTSDDATRYRPARRSKLRSASRPLRAHAHFLDRRVIGRCGRAGAAPGVQRGGRGRRQAVPATPKQSTDSMFDSSMHNSRLVWRRSARCAPLLGVETLEKKRGSGQVGKMDDGRGHQHGACLEMAGSTSVTRAGEDVGANGGVFRATAGLLAALRQVARADTLWPRD